MNEQQAYALTGMRGGFGAGRHYFRFWMPYLFQRIEHPSAKHVFLPLNRNYKPLGQMTKEHVDYDALALSHGVKFARDPDSFAGIWTKHQPEEGRFWLYDDGPDSRLSYFKRLEKLMAKSVDVVGQTPR